MKKITLFLLLVSLTLPLSDSKADDALAGDGDTNGVFTGTITALDSNGYDPGKCFTAVNDQGIVKVFRVSSLDNLSVGERVRLNYGNGPTYPLHARDVTVLSADGQ